VPPPNTRTGYIPACYVGTCRRGRLDHQGVELVLFSPDGRTLCQGSSPFGMCEADHGRPAPLPTDELAYDFSMGKTTQVAFQIDDESLAEIDALVTSQYRSRAEVIRVALHDWLARRRSEQVDAALARGYEVTPIGPDEDVWAELSVQ